MSTTSTDPERDETEQGSEWVEQPDDAAAARAVGEALRTVRRQKRLSLRAVEAATAQEFKASVLGAYERGDRIISVPRVQRLARYYGVPVDRLLSAADADAHRESGTGAHVDLVHAERSQHPAGSGIPHPVTIDLRKLEALAPSDRELLSRYLTMIQTLRRSGGTTTLTVRDDDVRVIATLLQVPPERIPELLALIADAV